MTTELQLRPFSARPLIDPEAVFGFVLHERSIGKYQDILQPGAIPQAVHMLLAGHAGRYQITKDGRRQITAVLVPGDICDLEAVMKGGPADYGASGLTPCTVGVIPLDWFDSVARGSDTTAIVLRHLRLDAARARQWVFNLGRLSSVSRTAFLLCELRERLARIGVATQDSCEMHFKQTDLADVLGLSLVHMNRALQTLRKSGLINLTNGVLTMLDRPKLEQLAQFSPSYLD